MRRFIVCLAITAILSLPSAGAQTPFEDISGDWATQGYGAVVRLARCEAAPQQLCGTLIWAWEPEELKPGSVGGLMFHRAVHDGERWVHGRLLNPEDGRTYSGSIKQIGPDRLELEGCAARIFCQRQTWRRLTSLPHVSPDVLGSVQD